ncbi:MAG: ABC transporter ATP-binding protein [Lachnospira sp.]|nr:ABC transporter ATP-binding protein [Lachnospira sp.]
MDTREYKTTELLKRFLPYYRPHAKTVALDLFCAALTTVCELVLPLIMRYITNEGMRDLAALSIRTVLLLGGIYFVLRIVDSIANYYMADVGHVMGARIETTMRRDAYSHLQQLSNTYYSNTKVGQIMGRITNDLFDVTEFAHHCPEEFFIAAIKAAAGFIILSGINIWLTLIIFLIVPIMFVTCMILNQKMKKAFAKQRYQIGELNARIEDSLLGQKVVKAFTNEEMENEKFSEDNQQFFEIKKETYKYMAAFQTTTRMFDGVMYLSVVIGGGIFMVKGLIQPGDLVAYMLYVTTLIATIRRIIEFAEQFQRGMTGIERFLQIMDADIDIFDEEGAVELTKVSGNITFEDVSFEYPDDHNEVFTNLNLSIQAGEKVAIVGPSGGGKTTLCNLIPRFYDIDSGCISLDGRNIKEFTLKSLRQHIGIVQQDVYLFSGTVYDNIIYGKPGASKDEVIAAAKLAGADGFIKELKDGYDTYIGERGVKLSGGQKQRISIARVFLKNPQILILDEATSALDNESEFEVAKSLAELSKGRTTLTIAHRLSSIRNSDRILVLTQEGIVEEGNHDALMKKKGLYFEFYTMADKWQ